MSKSTKCNLSLLGEVLIHRLTSEGNKSTPLRSEDTFGEMRSAGVHLKPSWRIPAPPYPQILEPSSLVSRENFCRMPTFRACHTTRTMVHSVLLLKLPAHPPPLQEMIARASTSLHCMYKVLWHYEIQKLTGLSSTDSENIASNEDRPCGGRLSTSHQHLSSNSSNPDEMYEHLEDLRHVQDYIAERTLERYSPECTHISAIAPQASETIRRFYWTVLHLGRKD